MRRPHDVSHVLVLLMTEKQKSGERKKEEGKGRGEKL